jgi:hypothetical protein
MTAPVQRDRPVSDPGGSARVMSPNELAYIAQAGGFPPEEIKTAVAVAMAESGGRLNAHNAKPPDDSYGLWQINMYASLGPARRAQFGIQDNKQLFGWETNAKAAYSVWKGGGWRQWSTYTSGAYKIYSVFAALGAAAPSNPGIVEGETNVIVGGKIPDLFADAIKWVLSLFAPVLLRVAGFVGGGILVIVGIVLYVRGQS